MTDALHDLDLGSTRLAYRPLPEHPLTAEELDRIGEIGVFIHLYYTELADETARQLLTIEPKAKFYVSTDTEAKASLIQETFDAYGLGTRLVIKCLPNLGWDICPFLLGFAQEIQAHTFVLRMHGKRSRHLPGDIGDYWRRMLFGVLAGSRERVRAIMRMFLAEESLGMAIPPYFDYYADQTKPAANFDQMQALLAKLELPISPTGEIAFPMGSMFWCRSASLQPLLDLELTATDFTDPAMNRDATLAHAIERSLLFFCAKAGLHWTSLPLEHFGSAAENWLLELRSTNETLAKDLEICTRERNDCNFWLIDSKEQLESCQRESAQFKLAVEEAALRLNRMHGELDQATQQRDRLQSELAATLERVDLLQAELESMLQSTSWRITRPLRQFKDTAQHLRNRLK